jgi:hypothetical protein
MYDAADNANNAYMHRLKNLIEAIRQGKRKPGEGLTTPCIEETVKMAKCVEKKKKIMIVLIIR